ncbi:MAG: hypothetical protein AAGI30_10285 [Planctomycetota bacterium]
MDGSTFRNSGSRDLLLSDRDVLRFPVGGVHGGPASADQDQLEDEVVRSLRFADSEIRALADEVNTVISRPRGDGDDFFPSAA